MAAGAQRRRLALGEVGSTNTVAMDAARAGDPGPLWVTAERQIEGRGRRGRAWVSEAGNLYATWLVIDPAPLEHLSKLPLVASLGVRNGLAQLLERQTGDVSVKWPNDVLIDEKKAVGILLESERLGDGRMAVVVGCGVNVAHVPADAPYAVTSLWREGCRKTLADIFQGVASEVESAFARFERGVGFAEIRREWLSHAIGVGETCRINLSNEIWTGRFEALDEVGRLILRRDDGQIRAISSGDLFFLATDQRVAPISAPASSG